MKRFVLTIQGESYLMPTGTDLTKIVGDISDWIRVDDKTEYNKPTIWRHQDRPMPIVQVAVINEDQIDDGSPKYADEKKAVEA